MPCRGKKSVQDEVILDRLQLIRSPYINLNKLSECRNGRISSIIDIYFWYRVLEKRGGEAKILQDSSYHDQMMLNGIPLQLKKQLLVNHFPGLKKYLSEFGPHFYQHLLNEVGMGNDDATRSPTNRHELQHCPTFSEGFLGLEEERSGRPVPFSKMTSINKSNSILNRLPTTPSGLETVSELWSKSNTKLGHSATDTGKYRIYPAQSHRRSDVQLGEIPKVILNASDSDSTIDNEVQYRHTDGILPTGHVSVQDLLTGEVPNLAHIRAASSHQITNYGSDSHNPNQYLSWLDLTDQSPAMLSRTSTTNLLHTDTSAFFSVTNLMFHQAKAIPGTFYSPVGRVQPKCFKQLVGRTFRYRMMRIPETIRPRADHSDFLWDVKASFWSGPPKSSNHKDKRYSVEGTTDWTQICTPDGLNEMRRQLWCLDLSLNKLEFCPAIPLLQICLYSWGFNSHESFATINKLLGANRQTSYCKTIPQLDWITKRKEFVLHIQYCLGKIKSYCPSVESHLKHLGFDLAAWMARHLQELLGRLLPWTLLQHVVYCTLFKGSRVPVSYMITIVCGLEGALLACDKLEHVAEILGSSHNMVRNWYVHLFDEPRVDDDRIAFTFMYIANRMLKKLNHISASSLSIMCNSKVTPYLMEVNRGKLYRVRFVDTKQAPPKCILNLNEWSAIWHALHPLYRECSPHRFYEMVKDGITIASIYASIHRWNEIKDTEKITRYSCCLMTMKLEDPDTKSSLKIAIMSPQNPFVPDVHGAIQQGYLEGDGAAFYQFKDGHTFTSSWAYDGPPMSFSQDAFEKDRKALHVGDAIVIPFEFGRHGIAISNNPTVFGNIGAKLDDPIHSMQPEDYKNITKTRTKRSSITSFSQSSEASMQRADHREYRVLNMELWTF